MLTMLKGIFAFGVVCLLALAALPGAPLSGQEEGPGRLELSSAKKYMADFEGRVKRARGQPFKLGHMEKEALKRIKALNEKYPDHPEVQELFQRARKAILASKGETLEITPAHLLYRQNEQKLKKLFSEKADEVWEGLLADARKNLAVEKPFPPPDRRDVDAGDLEGKYVILDNFEYPTNEFTSFQGQYVFIGSGARGFYYVILHTRPWRGAYEALRRYRRFVNRDLPEDGKWTLLARVVGLELMIPQAGKEKTESAHWGWAVEPVAIRVPGCTVAMADPKLELGGIYAGESEAEKIKSVMYTVKSIPDDVTPKRLAEIYVTAIKEKNYPLFLDCIDPIRKKTRTALSRIGYHWDLHQDRFASLYCHVTYGDAEVTVLKGFDPGEEDLESAFLTEEEKAEIKEHAEPLLEEALLWTKAWDVRGRQYGSPKPRFMRRYEKKRWYIADYAQQF